MQIRSVMAISSLSVFVAFTMALAAAPDTRRPTVGKEVLFEEVDGVVAVEAEHFYRQTLNDVRSWHLFTPTQQPRLEPDADPPHLSDASGDAYVEILPDTRRNHDEELINGQNFINQPGKMAVLHYKVHFNTPGKYYVWARIFSTGTEDNGMHVGIDGTWPATGQRMQWTGKQKWVWGSKQRTEKQHGGEPYKLYLVVDKPGEHEITFSMREDGTEFDKWMMIREKKAAVDGHGPTSRAKKGTSPRPRPAVKTIALPVAEAGKVTGELKKWHKVTIDFAGPDTSETATPNPCTDYRLDVTFRNGDATYVVPGYYAADGNAGNTSATSGNVWRVHFCPDRTGRWNYNVSFKKGRSVAVEGGGISAGACDGATGSFEIGPSDKTGRDHRGKGRLQYVGGRYLRFAETGEYFLKQGADAPENLFAYEDFDGDFKSDGKSDNRIKCFQPHVRDWKPGDPTWKNGKGKGLIGAINYLAGEGMNVFSFIPLNIDGDDKNVFPYLTYDERYRMDISRLDQWEIIFEHADRLGMFIHFKTLETENELLLDGGDLGPQRKLYYRELIARFGHHLAMNWNLGEEINDASTAQKKAWAQYFFDNDPYHHLVVIHNGASHFDLLGNDSKITGFSLQTNKTDFANVHSQVKNYLKRSAEAGKQWAVACDEPGDATHALRPDSDAGNSQEDGRKNGLWGTLMAGGWGNEWYFGYQHAHSDLTLEDFRSRDRWWDYCRYALEFFKEYEIPVWEMSSRDDLTSGESDYCLCNPGVIYVVYAKNGGSPKLDLSDAKGMFEVQWFDPRGGGPLQTGTVRAVPGGGIRSLGNPPKDTNKDWAILIRPADPNRNYPPAVSAGDDRSVMLPRDGNSVTVELDGSVADDGKPGKAITSRWSVQAGPGAARIANAAKLKTHVTLLGHGVYVLNLAASDGEQSAADRLKITVEPYSARVTKTFSPSEDAFLEGNAGHDTQQLKVEPKRRVSYLKFHVTGLPTKVIRATLQLTENGDPGGGTLQVHRGSNSDWSEKNLTMTSVPAAKELIAERAGQVGAGQTIEIDVTPLVKGNGTVTAVLVLGQGGNDIWLGSKSSDRPPQLIVIAEDPNER